ncbi:hypothetical protein PhCBS80983_g00209 [Powellomyces hirtus]|uniref:DUF2470 domain-containing protein n=1 Tax=Powellomyces hirtus TaxID=109895 RepID=A0A507EIB0_9FUNG|nr:hypothetical protein PhCBS80983_g00209 [Powellomyces hirtus]
MSMRNRKGPFRDPIAEHESSLLEFVNARDEDLINYAKYFAHSKMALKTKVTEIDSAGFTLQYVDKNAEGGLAQKDVRVQFDAPATTVHDVKKKLANLAKEAKTSLSLDSKMDKSYRAPGSDRLPQIEPVMGTAAVTGFLVLWATLIVGVLVPTLPPQFEELREHLGGRVMFERVAFGILLVHAIECVVVVAAAIYGSFELGDTIASLIRTLLFGLGSLGPVVKAAVNRRTAITNAAARPKK